MKKVISAKNEISALLYDIQRGRELGTCDEVLLNSVAKKLKTLIEYSERDYLSVRWER